MYALNLQLVNKGWDYTRERKKWVAVLAALGVSFYGAYRAYHLPSVVRKRERLSKLLAALISIAELVSDSSEAIGVISKDLKEFIQSDSDQIPNSLKQISKIARSDEFSESLSRITRALTVGILRGYRSEAIIGYSVGGDSSFSERVVDKILSNAGSGFASVVVGSFARNLVMGFYSSQFIEESLSEDYSGNNIVSKSSFITRWVDVVCDRKCREIIGNCIQLFVSTAVAVYLEKTMDVNPYDELFSGMTNPNHEIKVKEILTTVCNGAIETLVRTSYQVLNNENSNPDMNSSSAPIGLQSLTSESEGQDERESISAELKDGRSFDGNQSNDWVSLMSSTLAVPSNRMFVLDVTGTVTFETVRSFLEFFLEKLSDALKRSIEFVHEEVTDRGIEIYRYMRAKFFTVESVCVSLCLHILTSPWVFVPT